MREDQADIVSKIEERDKVADALEQLVMTQIEKALPALSARNPEVDWKEILELVGNAQDIRNEDDMQTLQERLKRDGTPDPQKIDAFCHLFNVLQTVRSYAPILSERALQTETRQAFKALRAAVREMKEKGISLDDAARFFDEIRISKSFTSHPTENLSGSGITLCRNLVAAAENDTPDARAQNIESVITDMILCQDFGASKKAGILEEIDASDALALIHNTGCNTLERNLEQIIKEEYGALPAQRICLDVGPRSWDYDSDGKNNAEGWAMMLKMSGTTQHMVKFILESMERAQASAPDLAADKVFTDLQSVLREIHTKLEPIHFRARQVVEALATTRDTIAREETYKKFYPELHKVTEDFGHLYDAVDAKNRGFHFYMGLRETLDGLRIRLLDENPEAAAPIDEACRSLYRNGMVLERGQTRQNDIIHTQIIDNLFNLPAFRARSVLEPGEWADIDSKGGMSKLDIDSQHRLLEKVSAFSQTNGNRKLLLSDLFEANPLSFDAGGNGFPRQERTLLDRFSLRALYPLKFDHGIISDCGDLGPARQMFIADLFGMRKMRHMPLYEGRSTLSRQPQLLELFQRTGGSAGVNRRRTLTMTDPVWDAFYRGRDVHDISTMFPCSDGEKLAGSATRLETFHSVRTDIRESYNRRTPLEIMLGGGLSMGRFGGDPAVIRRLAEQELKSIAIERGRPFSRGDKLDRRMMRVALAILYTEQGRATRYYTATPGQVADLFATRITEMIYGRLDLEGLVPDYQYINKPGTMTPAMQTLSNHLRDKAIDDFIKLRFAVTEPGTTIQPADIITNRLARLITTPNTISFMNNGARPDSKSGSKEMTEVRAIENNERDYISRLHMGGYFGSGALMYGLWNEVRAGTHSITSDDVSAFINDPQWAYNFFTKNVADAGRADFSYALKQTGWEDATFDDLVRVGQSMRFVKLPGQDHHRVVYDTLDGSVTPEQAYIAKVFYDRLLFLSLFEAALDTQAGMPAFKAPLEDIISALRPADNTPHLAPGPRTQTKYSASMAIVAEHKRNLPAFAVQYMLEAHIAGRIQSGDSKENAVAELGGEAILRRASSAYRAGTVPHWVYWSGLVNYGQPHIPRLPAPRPGWTIPAARTPEPDARS